MKTLFQSIFTILLVGSLSLLLSFSESASSHKNNAINFNDECSSAFQLTVYNDVCLVNYQFCTSGATPSPEPIDGLCIDLANGNTSDYWYTVSVPSTGVLMLRANFIDDQDLPVVASYVGDCSNLNYVQCDTLYGGTHVTVFDMFNPGDQLFFRLFDALDDKPDATELLVYEMPTNPDEWELCSHPESTGQVANQFIVQYDATATPADIATITGELQGIGAILFDECICSPQPIQLWGGSNPVDVEDKRKAARAKTKIDTVDYNFIIYRDSCNTTLYPVDNNIVSNDQNRQAFGCAVGGGTVVPYVLPPYNPPSNTSYSVKVGVVDTGVEADHDWVENALWSNPELNDSDNCVLNDIYGYDFVGNLDDPIDFDGHGTSVNSVITNDFPSEIDLDIINLKFYDDDKGKLFDALCSIHYAINEGVKVLNLSWGFFHPEMPPLLRDALERAVSEDILIVNSAGNSNLNNDSYEAEKLPSNNTYDNFITVAAIHRLPVVELAGYSNYGSTSVDLGAEGYMEVARLGNSSAILHGTSLAAPRVARTAAIIRGYYPMLSAVDVRDCILSSVDVEPSLVGFVATGGALNHVNAVDCAYNKALMYCSNSDIVVTGNIVVDSTVITSANILSDAQLTAPVVIRFDAGNAIHLQDGFHAGGNVDFNAKIEGCGTIPVPLNGNETKH